jgi:hypothetical protein
MVVVCNCGTGTKKHRGDARGRRRFRPPRPSQRSAFQLTGRIVDENAPVMADRTLATMLAWAEDTARDHIARMEAYRPPKAGDPRPELR